MRLLSRLAGTAEAKAFVQPPFWSTSAPMWSSMLGDKERIGNDFTGYVQGAYKANGVVFACISARMFVFTEARFAWRRLEDGRPADLFTDERLALLRNPWTNGTTGELLARMEQDASLAGNSYNALTGVSSNQRIRRLRPDWVTIVTGSPDDDPYSLDADVLGYLYHPGGRVFASKKPEVLLPSEVAHYSPIPDPEAQWRGMSWLTPVLSEIEADRAATKHKLQFFKNGATANFAITYDKDVGRDDLERLIDLFKQKHEGTDNAYKTIHLGGGADAKSLSADLRQLEFKATQGAGETRIAAASGVGAVIANLSEGLQGSSLNAGNFGAARRRFADGLIRPLWRIAAGALQSITPAPDKDTELWYDDLDVPFLREDAKEAAEIQKAEAETIANLVREGFTADSAVKAVTSGDLRKLEHSGRLSVQLQEPGDQPAPPQE